MQFVLTTAGLAALVNPANTGTNAIQVTQIGLSDVALAGDPEDHVGLSSLPDEIKRLSTFAGEAVGDDTIHVTIRDETPDVYELRTFGLYEAGGVLLAYYTQPDPIMEKAAASMLLLAADLRFTTPIEAEVQFGATDWINPPATSETPGVVELATKEETSTGVDATRAVTPFGLKWVLDALLAMKSSVGHTHGAGDTVSGVFAAARIPSLDAGKTTSGTFDPARLPAATTSAQGAVELATSAETAAGADAVRAVTPAGLKSVLDTLTASITGWLAGKSDTGHTHGAGDIVSGTLADARIPSLNASKINAGAFDPARLPAATASAQGAVELATNAETATGADAVRAVTPAGLKSVLDTLTTTITGWLAGKADTGHTHAAVDIVSGTLADARIPSLNASKINAGAFDPARLPAATASARGAVELATNAEASAGSDTTRAVTPAGLKTAVDVATAAATAAQYRGNSGAQPVHPSTAWAAADLVTLSQASTIAVNLAAGINFTTTMTGNRTLGAPSNAKPGQSGIIEIKQDATGGRTLGFNAAWKFVGGSAPTLTPVANARDILAYTVIASGDVVASLLRDVR